MSPRNHNLTGRLLRTLFGLCLLLAAISGQAIERVTFYHNDALGSPVAATDASGTLLWRESYAPYGKRLTREAGSKHTVWFTGKPEEAAFGLSYFGARWYDPTIGRFLAMDPAGFNPDNIHSFGRYAYANNNPYAYVDPDGNQPYRAATEVRSVPEHVQNRTAALLLSGLFIAGSYGVLGPAYGTILDVSLFAASGGEGPFGGKGVRSGKPDFVVPTEGPAVPVSQSRMRQGFNDAGFPSRPSTKTSEPGVIHTVPTPKGLVDVRTMEGSAHHPRRAIISTPGTNSPRTPSGGTPRGRKQQRRAASHFEQSP